MERNTQVHKMTSELHMYGMRQQARVSSTKSTEKVLPHQSIKLALSLHSREENGVLAR